VNDGSQGPIATHTLEEFVKKEWEPAVLPSLKFASRKHYKYVLGTHVLPAMGSNRLREIKRDMVQRFVNAKLESGLSWKTVNHLRCALWNVMRMAEESDYIESNPVPKTRMPRRGPQKEKLVLTPEQISSLVEVLEEPARTIVALLIRTGMRIGELLALRWRNVDLENGIVRVAQTVYDGHFDEPKTKRSNRSIPLGQAAITMLAARRPDPNTPESLVFASSLGTPICRRNLMNRHVRPACEKIGLSAFGWHTLRHSYATLLDSVGAPLGTVQAFLGHSSPEVTREIYLHSLPANAKNVVEKMDELLIGPKRTQMVEIQNSGTTVIQ